MSKNVVEVLGAKQVFFNIQNGTQALLLAPKWTKIS